MGYNIQKIPAKPISYGSNRPLSNIQAIVIHYTAGNGDTAVNEGNYFARSNNRQAGAHYFVDQAGNIVESISMEKTAWSVGGAKYSDCTSTGGGKYYGRFNNSNTVSIELCDILKKQPSDKMIAATKWLISYIRSKCPNAKTLCYHHDINGKHCPLFATNNKAYATSFLKIIDPDAVTLDKPKYKAKLNYTILKEVQIFTEPTTKSRALTYQELNDAAKKKDKNKNGRIDKGSVIECKDVVVKENGNQFVKVANGWIKAYDKATNDNRLRKKS